MNKFPSTVIWFLLVCICVSGQDSNRALKDSQIQAFTPQEGTKIGIVDSLLSQNSYALVIPHLIQMVDGYKNKKNEEQEYKTRILLAKCFQSLGWYKKAIDQLNLCQAYYLDVNKKVEWIDVIHQLADCYLSQSYPDLAKYLLEKCDKEEKFKEDRFLKMQHLSIKAMMDLEYNLYPTALANAKVVHEYARQKNLPELYFHSLKTLGKLHFKNGRWEQAKIALSQALEISSKLHYLKESQILSNLLYHTEYNTQNYKVAIDYLNQSNSLKDSLNVLSTEESLERTVAKFENISSNQLQLEEQSYKKLFELKARRSNFAFYSLIFSIIGILAATYFIIMYYQQKLETTQIINEQNSQINKQKIIQLENDIQIQSMESMLNGQEIERDRISKDLHDSLGGLLSTIKLHFDNLHAHGKFDYDANKYQKIHKLIDQACNEVRDIAHDLNPGALEKLGLIQAVTDLINRNDPEGVPEITFQYYGFDGNGKLDGPMAINSYRIVQELINNALKHSNAKELLVQINKKPDELSILVEDDGVGFLENQVKPGMGLDNIKSRISYLKGEMNVQTIPGKGTSTLITIPLRHSEHNEN